MIINNYIKMCEQAKKIQEEWKPQLGDWFYSKEVDDNVIILGFTKESRKVIDKGIYLPTQEQLQGMIYSSDWHNIFKAFLWWYGDANIKEFTSITELWLAFVMKEKYNKIWTGKDWVKGE